MAEHLAPPPRAYIISALRSGAPIRYVASFNSKPKTHNSQLPARRHPKSKEEKKEKGGSEKSWELLLQIHN
jgi:hypothetical protein